MANIYAEALAPVVLFFHQFCGTRCKVSIETCKARRTRYYLGLEYVIRSVVLELWRDLPTLIAVSGDLDFPEDNTAQLSA